MADQEFQVTDDITVCIDSTLATPLVRFKCKGELVREWKLQRITEDGNLWLPFDYCKNGNL